MDMKSGSSVKSAAWNIKHWLIALAAAHHITSHHPTHQQITTEQVSSGFFSSSLTSQVKDHGAHLVCISFACRERTSGMFKLIKLSIIDYKRWSLEGSWQNTRRWFNAIKPEPINRMAQYARSMLIIYHHIISYHILICQLSNPPGRDLKNKWRPSLWSLSSYATADCSHKLLYI